ncbi:MAG: hypothetical protein ACREH5_02205, partial [Candidatus Omnitrophota bacterium]
VSKELEYDTATYEIVAPNCTLEEFLLAVQALEGRSAFWVNPYEGDAFDSSRIISGRALQEPKNLSKVFSRGQKIGVIFEKKSGARLAAKEVVLQFIGQEEDVKFLRQLLSMIEAKSEQSRKVSVSVMLRSHAGAADRFRKVLGIQFIQREALPVLRKMNEKGEIAGAIRKRTSDEQLPFLDTEVGLKAIKTDIPSARVRIRNLFRDLSPDKPKEHEIRKALDLAISKMGDGKREDAAQILEAVVVSLNEIKRPLQAEDMQKAIRELTGARMADSEEPIMHLYGISLEPRGEDFEMRIGGDPRYYFTGRDLMARNDPLGQFMHVLFDELVSLYEGGAMPFQLSLLYFRDNKVRIALDLVRISDGQPLTSDFSIDLSNGKVTVDTAIGAFSGISGKAERTARSCAYLPAVFDPHLQARALTVYNASSPQEDVAFIKSEIPKTAHGAISLDSKEIATNLVRARGHLLLALGPLMSKSGSSLEGSGTLKEALFSMVRSLNKEFFPDPRAGIDLTRLVDVETRNFLINFNKDLERLIRSVQKLILLDNVKKPLKSAKDEISEAIRMLSGARMAQVEKTFAMGNLEKQNSLEFAWVVEEAAATLKKELGVDMTVERLDKKGKRLGGAVKTSDDVLNLNLSKGDKIQVKLEGDQDEKVLRDIVGLLDELFESNQTGTWDHVRDYVRDTNPPFGRENAVSVYGYLKVYKDDQKTLLIPDVEAVVQTVSENDKAEVSPGVLDPHNGGMLYTVEARGPRGKLWLIMNFEKKNILVVRKNFSGKAGDVDAVLENPRDIVRVLEALVLNQKFLGKINAGSRRYLNRFLKEAKRLSGARLAAAETGTRIAAAIAPDLKEGPTFVPFAVAARSVPIVLYSFSAPSPGNVKISFTELKTEADVRGFSADRIRFSDTFSFTRGDLIRAAQSQKDILPFQSPVSLTNNRLAQFGIETLPNGFGPFVSGVLAKEPFLKEILPLRYLANKGLQDLFLSGIEKNFAGLSGSQTGVFAVRSDILFDGDGNLAVPDFQEASQILNQALQIHDVKGNVVIAVYGTGLSDKAKDNIGNALKNISVIAPRIKLILVGADDDSVKSEGLTKTVQQAVFTKLENLNLPTDIVAFSLAYASKDRARLGTREGVRYMEIEEARDGKTYTSAMFVLMALSFGSDFTVQSLPAELRQYLQKFEITVDGKKVFIYLMKPMPVVNAAVRMVAAARLATQTSA